VSVKWKEPPVDELSRITVRESRHHELPGGSFRLPKSSKKYFGCSSSGCLTLVFLLILVIIMHVFFHS